MRRLRHTLSLGAGETPASFVSRLAALHGLSAREFCLDMGTRFQRIVDGDAGALGIIAAKSSVDPLALAANAFIKTGNLHHTARNEQLTRTDLRRAAVFVCPKCLTEDIAAAPRARPQTVAYQRVHWQIGAIKTCPVHRAPLTAAARDQTPNLLHDWAHHVAKIFPDLPRLVEHAETRDPTRFEMYVLDRMNGRSAEAGLLAPLPLFVAIAGCELFGAVAAFGRMPNLKALTDEERRQAGAAGFEILVGGKPSLDSFLGGLQATYPYTRAGTEGPQAVFGRIYQTLEFGREDPAFDPLRDLVGSFIRGHFPLAAGDTVFGAPVPQRTLHSIRTLSLETGQHPKRLRKLLEASGAVPPASRALADQNVVFPVQAASRAALEASAALSLPAAGQHLNAPRCQIRLLAAGGFIKPILAARGAAAYDRYAFAELDAFLGRLLDGAATVHRPKAHQVDIPAAAKRACCSAATVLQFVLDKKLAWVGRCAGAVGYMSVLVDVDEVRRLVRGDDHGGFTPREVSVRLGVADRVVGPLIEHGYLRGTATINPINRCPQIVVMPADLEAFERTYVSLFRLAKERGEHFRKVKKALDDEGVEPAFDPATIGATFYRRSDVAPSHPNRPADRKGRSK